MHRYLETARRYRWVLVVVLLLLWGSGVAAAVVEYLTTYQSEATVWTQRSDRQFAISSSNDPSLALLQSPASEQGSLFDQLLQTTSFTREVVLRTSLRPVLEAAKNEASVLDEVRKRFRVEVLGTNLVRISYRAKDPHTASEMVAAALAVRDERVTQARVTATSAASTIYGREFDLAQANALKAQSDLSQFDAAHKPPLSADDERRLGQLRLAVDVALARAADLKARIDQATLAPMLLDVTQGMEFQVIDPPREEPSPSGGLRSAATLAGVALLVGAGLAVLLVLAGTLLVDYVSGEEDLARLPAATLFATVPALPWQANRAGSDLRGALTRAAFREAPVERKGTGS